MRTGGCDYRCAWCDSLHAVDAEYRDDMGADERAGGDGRGGAALGRPALMVTLSGGNPAIQPLGPLIAAGQAQGYRFALETQGSVARDWFSVSTCWCCQPKPPSSGMVVDWAAFEACRAAAKGAETVLKIVIFDEADYLWAREVAGRYPDAAALPATGQPHPAPARGRQRAGGSGRDRRADALAGGPGGGGWLVRRDGPAATACDALGQQRGV